MAKYNDPKTGKTFRAANSKVALATIKKPEKVKKAPKKETK